jgi:hypothetical protein
VTEANHNYDVYIRIFKDGKVSAPLKINTGSGNGSVDWEWGGEPYLKLYVKSDGLDINAGDRDNPLATVKKALDKLAAAYAEPSWPGKGTDEEKAGAIIIMDTVTVTERTYVNNAAYPGIILSDDPGMPGGILKAAGSIGKGFNLLTLEEVKVTLEGSLRLEGTGNSADNVHGVSVYTNATFIMNGGVIAGFTGDSSSRGVYVTDRSTFIMNGGVITNNSSSGVYVNGTGTFIMTGGVISGNSAIYGGGVRLNSASTTVFNKTGGIIYGYNAAAPNDPNSNKAVQSETIVDNHGHAVYAVPARFIDTTLGPEDNLRYNYPNSGDMFGWE